jgi:hypothetical protein
MTIEHWRNTFDIVKLGGRTLPGIARVGFNVPDCQDRRKGRGKKKAKTRDDGEKPAELDIELEMTPFEYDQFATFMPMLRPRGKTTARSPLKIVHPDCVVLGISTVSIGRIRVKPLKGGETRIVNIQAFEWERSPATIKESSRTDKPLDSEPADGWDIGQPDLPSSQSPRP